MGGVEIFFGGGPPAVLKGPARAMRGAGHARVQGGAGGGSCRHACPWAPSRETRGDTGGGIRAPPRAAFRAPIGSRACYSSRKAGVRIFLLSDWFACSPLAADWLLYSRYFPPPRVGGLAGIGRCSAGGDWVRAVRRCAVIGCEGRSRDVIGGEREEAGPAAGRGRRRRRHRGRTGPEPGPGPHRGQAGPNQGRYGAGGWPRHLQVP